MEARRAAAEASDLSAELCVCFLFKCRQKATYRLSPAPLYALSRFASPFIDRHDLNNAAFTLDSGVMAQMIRDNMGP